MDANAMPAGHEPAPPVAAHRIPIADPDPTAKFGHSPMATGADRESWEKRWAGRLDRLREKAAKPEEESHA